jgi:hypothetical protein
MPDSPELLQNPVLQNVKKRADGDLCKAVGNELFAE